MRAVERILAVLECFTPAKTSLTIQQASEQIGLPKSTVFRLMQSLERAGYLIRLEDLSYCLSFRLTRLAGLVKSTLDIREIARPVMSTLADRTHETIAIHTVVGGNRVCIDSIASQASPLRSIIHAGEQIALQAGSASKTLLAHMPAAQLATLLPTVVELTGRAPTDLQAEFVRIRQQGYAVSHGERLPGLSAISAPIQDVKEAVHYCLTLNGPSFRVRDREMEFVRLVRKAASDVSRQYGGRIPIAA